MLGDRIEKLRQKKKLTVQRLADEVGVSRVYMQELKAGKKNPSDDLKKRLAEVLNTTIAHLMGEDSPAMVPIVGYVGAGAEIYPINDYPNGCGIDEVEAPEGHNGKKIVAVCIRGDSMEPVYSEGDILYYSREWDYVPANCIGRKCIVHTADGRTLVKKLLAGTRPGYWQIFSYNGGKIEEVELAWAAPVIYVKYA